eukprot:CAMPEP_0182947340 /NCGR_PEP_ID=MMETSP0105_2-20130417/58428_1 /TAXON_ID=81532 ORGANISM="Acanthoeca-like sp., Strain 10tr" /NCGR_SAMPLE_ID=MMETSP0105_2 /ASSEMBLY_ACC=CAM_ASM_000205 /LENGTH=166 /DNA_ID=CAMNT_0025087559 /DNA_START=93 /DNA_END=591 /DNA_ORIENTATION=-
MTRMGLLGSAASQLGELLGHPGELVIDRGMLVSAGSELEGVERRGTPSACNISWHARTASSTSSISPSTFVPYECVWVMSSPGWSWINLTALATSPPTEGDRAAPRGTTQTSAMQCSSWWPSRLAWPFPNLDDDPPTMRPTATARATSNLLSGTASMTRSLQSQVS